MSSTRRIYAGAALTVAALVAVLALAGRIDSQSTAASKVEVVSVDPADGAVLSGAPTAVRIRVAGRPDLAGSHISVYDADRSLLNQGALTAAGRDGLTQAVRATGSGEVAVAYHVVTVDGRDASGIARFTVGAPGGAPPPEPPAPAHAHGIDPVGAALLAVDGLALLAVLVLLARRSRTDRDIA
ncbi:MULTISPECIES: copper resistance CopC family protein [unclassified Micromonospora]|uniref:CalU20 n=1 Tax=Micromonospora echinospora TaxID=1877 RepID=Q8KNC6_MICEC|nr:CalU20 [Micromonospora echinospora]